MKLQSILAALCLLAAIAAYALTPHQRLAELEPINLEQMIPSQFGEWKMEPTSEAIISSPEQDAEIKKIYSQTLSRTYVNSQNQRVMLSVAYTRDQSDNTGSQSHKPEICYPAQGFTIESNRISTLNTGPGMISVKELLAVQGGRVEPIIYWTMVGNRVAINSWQLKSAQLSYGLNDIIPDGLVFRVSSINGREKDRYALLKAFVTDLIASLDSVNRNRLSGL